MPHSANHAKLAVVQDPHAAQILNKIAKLEEELNTVAQHTYVWDDVAKQLKRQKLQLRDELAALHRGA